MLLYDGKHMMGIQLILIRPIYNREQLSRLALPN